MDTLNIGDCLTKLFIKVGLFGIDSCSKPLYRVQEESTFGLYKRISNLTYLNKAIDDFSCKILCTFYTCLHFTRKLCTNAVKCTQVLLYQYLSLQNGA